MKKISLIIVLILCFAIQPIFALSSSKYDYLLVENNVIQYDRKFKMDYKIPFIKHFPFIYSEENEFHNKYVIGPADCKEGYLYSKDLETGIIRQLVSVPVSVIREDESGVHFIYGNAILKVDFFGENIELIYSTNKKISNDFLVLMDNTLFFKEEDGDIVKFDIASARKDVIFHDDKVIDLLAYSDNEFFFKYNDDEFLMYNSLTKESVTKDKGDIVDLYVFTYDENESEQSRTEPFYFRDPNMNAVLDLYPNGSYFTHNGQSCGQHPCLHSDGSRWCSYWDGCNCKSYTGAIQCFGFGKYAASKYAHLNGWNPVSADEYEPSARLTTKSEVIAYFSKFNIGSFLWLNNTSADNWRHCIFYGGITSNNIIIYDCNYGTASSNRCRVKHAIMTFSAFMSSYDDWGTYAVSHNYSTCTNYSSTYHKQFCSNCSAFRYEEHYSVFPGPNARCDGCGYRGNITQTEPLPAGSGW